MDSPKVLLVEDARDMQLMVRAAIGADCELVCASGIVEALSLLRPARFALMILDVNLPDGDGFEFCRQLRADSAYRDLPIIFLTGQTEIAQRVHGFDLGADDYILKPLEPTEFRARVLARLKRKQIANAQTSFIQGPFQINLSAQKAYLRTGGSETELNLTPIEFKLLVQFLRNEGRIFSRKDLLVAVWGSTVNVSGHTIDTHISSLRKKLGPQGSCFKAVVRQGYRYVSATE